MVTNLFKIYKMLILMRKFQKKKFKLTGQNIKVQIESKKHYKKTVLIKRILF